MSIWQETGSVQKNKAVFGDLFDKKENISNHSHENEIKDINFANISPPDQVGANYGQSD